VVPNPQTSVFLNKISAIWAHVVGPCRRVLPIAFEGRGFAIAAADECAQNPAPQKPKTLGRRGETLVCNSEQKQGRNFAEIIRVLIEVMNGFNPESALERYSFDRAAGVCTIKGRECITFRTVG
jgi:hypothetical protein